MKSILRSSLACAFVLTSQLALAADAPTNTPAVSTTTNAPAVTSTNAGARILTLRSELRELNGKLRDLQSQCTNAPSVQAIMTEYETGRQELQALNKKLQEIQQRLQDAVIAEIVKKDPASKQLIDRRQELMNEIKAAQPAINLSPRMVPPGHPPIAPATGTQPAPAPAPAPAEKK